ncbi:MAG: M28 family peptidase [Candidatus Promineifilaceae bacterium]|nr:M28 family peptidase [Candidatus Promineifilaceae bacterium]
MIDNPYLTIDRLIIGDIYTSDELMENLLMLCDRFGSRFAGSTMEREAAEYMKEKMESYGLSNVVLEPVNYNGWQRGEVILKIVEPVERSVPCITLPHSPAADISGYIVDVGQGSPVEFDNLADEIAGRIVLTTSHTYPNGSKRWIHRNEKFGRSVLAGALGFIFVNHYPGYGPATGGIGYDNPQSGAALIPGLSVAMEDGAFIQRLLKRHGAVKVHLQSSDINEPATSWNVIADLPGKLGADGLIMLGCHYDGHDISQGAADPASGTVALLEAARVLSQYAPDLPFTIRFALWSAEEIGLIGSSQYVQQHAHELDQVRFYLNMDMAGAMDPQDIILNEWPVLESLFKKWRDEMVLDFAVGQSLNAHSDHYPFMLAGVPTGGIGSLNSSKGGRGYGHTKYDTVDKVKLRGMREAAAFAARLALRMAAERDWPVQRRSEEDVKKVLDSPDYREEIEFYERLNAYYRQNIT